MTTEKAVNLKIDITGMSEMRAKMRSVSDMAKDMHLQIYQAWQRSNNRIKELEQDKLRAIKKFNQNLTDDVEGNARKRADIEERYANRIQREQQRHMAARQQSYERLSRAAQKAGEKQGTGGAAAGFDLSAIGHLAQSVGFYRAGHLIRAAGQLGIGSEMGGGGALAAVGGLGGVAAVAAPAALALGAIIVEAKLVELGFQGLQAVSEHLAQAFIGAITTLGGARNLQEMIVESETKRQSIAATRFVVTPEERVSQAQLGSWAARMAANPALGGISSEKWIEAAKQYGTDTGFQKRLINDTQTSQFLGTLTNASKTDLGQNFHLFGLLQAQNPEMSNKDIQGIMMGGIGIGQHGAFNLQELASNPELFSQVSQIGGDKKQAYNTVFGVASLLKKRTGSLTEANTGVTGLLRALSLSHQQGHDFGHFVRGRSANLAESVADAASRNPDTLPKAWNRIESKRALFDIREQAGVTDRDTQAQAKEKILSMIQAEESFKMSTEELNKLNEESIGPTEKLKAAFNDLADKLEPGLNTILQDLVPKLQNFINILVDNKENINAAISDLIQALVELAPVVGLAGLALAYFTAKIGALINNLSTYLDISTHGLLHDQLAPIEEFGLHLEKAGLHAEDAFLDMKRLFDANMKQSLVGPGGITGPAPGEPGFVGPLTAAEEAEQKALQENTDATKNLTREMQGLKFFDHGSPGILRDGRGADDEQPEHN